MLVFGPFQFKKEKSGATIEFRFLLKPPHIGDVRKLHLGRAISIAWSGLNIGLRNRGPFFPSAGAVQFVQQDSLPMKAHKTPVDFSFGSSVSRKPCACSEYTHQEGNKLAPIHKGTRWATWSFFRCANSLILLCCFALIGAHPNGTWTLYVWSGQGACMRPGFDAAEYGYNIEDWIWAKSANLGLRYDSELVPWLIEWNLIQRITGVSTSTTSMCAWRL